MLSQQFEPAVVHLDAATYGLPPSNALADLRAATDAWARGVYDPTTCDQAVESARASFARLHRVGAADVAIGHQVSPMVGLVAASLPRGARVVAAEGDFTSLLFPLLAAGCALRMVPLERLAEAIEPDDDLVAVSAVQSADGRLADLEAIARAAADHGTLTLIDATQASGWLPLDAGLFSVLVAGGYKWMCHPRGTAFMTIAPALRDRVAPLSAGWYSTESPWETCYGAPLRVAADARRFDVSPAWLAWHAAATALELFETAGIEPIQRHNVELANRLRAGLGLEASNSAIISLELPETTAARLERAGIKASVRAGRVRLACHVYNTERDVDLALEALTS